MSNEDESEIGVPGCAGCVPVTSQTQLVVLNVAVWQQERLVGAGACVPVTSQEQVPELKVAVWQQAMIGCCGLGVMVRLSISVLHPVTLEYTPELVQFVPFTAQVQDSQADTVVIFEVLGAMVNTNVDVLQHEAALTLPEQPINDGAMA